MQTVGYFSKHCSVKDPLCFECGYPGYQRTNFPGSTNEFSSPVSIKMIPQEIVLNSSSLIGSGYCSNRKEKWKSKNPEDLADERSKPVIIAYGAASFGYLCGNITEPAKHIKRSLLNFVKARNKHSLTFLVQIDVYLTSQICPVCNTRTTTYVRDEGKEDIYPVLVCSKCNTFWNRDYMYSLDIRAVFMYMADNNNRRPKLFKRPSKKESAK